MKNKDRFWELATSRIHGEISANELVELDLLLQNETNILLYQEIVRLKNDVSGIENISGVSQSRSWAGQTE